VNKVVARYADGRIVRGSTGDFSPARSVFHVAAAGSIDGPIEIQLRDLKALFFVRDLVGDPARQERKTFDPDAPAPGRRIRVEFKDGEVLVGTTQGYQPDRPGFFLALPDSSSNNERCYVVSAAVRAVTFLK
jgi:hypothetical protein